MLELAFFFGVASCYICHDGLRKERSLVRLHGVEVSTNVAHFKFK